MFLFLRYNRFAQIILSVIVIGLIGGGSFYVFSSKSEKSNNVNPVTTQSSPVNTVGSNQPVTTPSVPANVSIPESKGPIGDLAWSGDLKTLDMPPLPDSRAVVATDPKTDFTWPSSGRNLNIRRTNTPITTYYAAIVHQESVSELFKMYSDVATKAGYKLQSSIMNTDLTATKRTTDIHKAVNAYLVFVKGSDQLSVAIQAPLNVGNTILPSMVEININKIAVAPAQGAVSPTPVPSASA